MRGQGRGVLLIVAVAVGSAAVGWIAARGIESPAIAASRTAPPPPSLITAPVELRVLEATVIVRGDASFADLTSISLVAHSGPEGTEPVLTGAPLQVGAAVEQGDLIAEVSGRPVFVLEGELPMFRDLRPGSSGADVLQLEACLARLGFLEAVPGETFDDATEAAITSWYAAAGYTAAGPTSDETQRLAAARDRVQAEEAAVLGSEEAIAVATMPPTRSERLQVEATVTIAQIALTNANEAAAEANQRATGIVATATEARDVAQEAAEVAADRLRQALDGTHPDTGEPPTEEQVVELQAAADETAKVLDNAQVALIDALASQEATAQEHAVNVLTATQQLDIAKAQRAEMDSPPDIDFLKRALESAKKRLAAARTDFEMLQTTMGVSLPRSEVVYVDALPQRVDSLHIALGGTITDPFMVLSGTQVRIETSMSSEELSLVAIGDRVLIGDEQLDGTVAEIADRPGTNGAPIGLTRVTVVPDDPEIGESLAGRNLRLVIPTATTDGEVLVVPITALVTSADGTTWLELETDSGGIEVVNVTVGLAVDGHVEVSSDDQRLSNGATVVLGRS